MSILIGVLLFACVAAFVLWPLLRAEPPEARENPEIADLQARKDAKYREIRDAELDLAAGKLNREDFDRQDAELRREAVEILRELDRATAAAGTAATPDEAGGGASGAPSP